MIEALLAIVFGAGLAKAVLWPVEEGLAARRRERDTARAQAIVADIHRRVPPMPEPRA